MTANIIVAIIFAFALVGIPAVHFGLKARKHKSMSIANEPRFTSPESTTPQFTSASKLRDMSTNVANTPADNKWKRLDDVLGTITIDDIDYTTYEAGEVCIHDKHGRAVIAFKVDGYSNDQRTINYIRVSEDIDKKDGVIYYVKYNANDAELFNQWLNDQLYGKGVYTKEAQCFRECMEKVAVFNNLLATKTLRYRGGTFQVS